MCGIVGIVSPSHVNQLIYDALLLLQHRGQDAAGIVTQLDRKFFMQKAKGMVRDVFRTRNMRALPGNIGLGQVRYPTAGNAYSEEEAQPFYVNAPFGLVMVHNGNLTNAHALKAELFSTDHRHINTESDSEVLLNVLAHELEKTTRGNTLAVVDVFAAISGVHRRIKGSYAVIAMIAGHGLLAFRDPFGIRPLCLGQGSDGTWMVGSESVALEGTGHVFVRDVAPGEAVFIDMQGQLHASQCANASRLMPCIFEYVYLARPDSTMDGISVYQARLNLGESLAKRVVSTLPPSDSIVRGTTSKEIVQMARDAGAKKVYLASAAPPVRYPNVYGIDMPTSEELVAFGRSVEQVRELIGCDALIYQDIAPMLDAVKRAALPGAPTIHGFDASCFDGVYITGDVSVEDITRLGQHRVGVEEDTADHSRLALPNADVR